MRPQTYHSLFLYVISGIFLCFSSTPLLHAQRPIGGPYEPDSATVLLMHFDGDLQNETSLTSDGEAFGETSFVNQTESDEFGQQLRLLNKESSEQYYIKVPDTSALDLTGDWTIEMWVKINSILYNQNDWKINNPYFIIKLNETMDSNSFYSNYFIHLFGTNLDYSIGYHSEKDSELIHIRSNEDIANLNEWYHVTFIRDTSRQIIKLLVHQNANNPESLPDQSDSLERVYYDIYDYGENDETGAPRITEGPLYIGANPNKEYSELDGYIDEVRISNKVRFKSTITSFTQEGSSLPAEIYLEQNYPNPFNPDTQIEFRLLHESKVELAVYDVLGRRVETLINEQRSAGHHKVSFKATGLTSGVYIYKLRTNNHSKVRKMLLVK